MIRRKLVLHVEDEEDHALLVKRCFDRIDPPIDLVHVSDGEQVRPFLDKGRLPDLILLDLRLPRRDGLEVLEDLKSDETYRRIPVIVLTTSSAHSDIERAADRFTNGYVVKPVELQALRELVERIDEYWLQTDRLPSIGERG